MTARLQSSKDIELNEYENNNSKQQAYIPASRSAVIDPDHSEVLDEKFDDDEVEPTDEIHKQMKLVRKALLLSIAYSCKCSDSRSLSHVFSNIQSLFNSILISH